MTIDYRYFPALSIPGGTTGQVLTKSSDDPDNGAQWSDPQAGTGPIGPAGATGPVGPAGAAGAAGPGIPGTADHYGYLRAGGCATTPSRQGLLATSGSTSDQDGRLYVSYFRAPSSFTCSQFRVFSSIVSGGPPTLVRAALYSVDANFDLSAIIASTVNDVGFLGANFTFYTKSWQAPVAIVADAWYAFACLVVGASAGMAGISQYDLFGTLPLASPPVEPMLVGSIGGQTDLPTSATAASLTASPGSGGPVSGLRLWAELSV